MSEAMALLRQIDSDARAAARVYDQADVTTYCQSVAKSQQVAEKCVKAVVAALGEAGRVSVGTGFSHDPSKLLSALLHLPGRRRDASVRSIQFHVRQVFEGRWWGEIRAVCALAPRRPDPGQLRARNAEYPYHNADGTWRAPADADSFAREEVDRFQRLARELYPEVARLVSGISRIST